LLPLGGEEPKKCHFDFYVAYGVYWFLECFAAQG
jgi:hypothetical protein